MKVVKMGVKERAAEWIEEKKNCQRLEAVMERYVGVFNSVALH